MLKSPGKSQDFKGQDSSVSPTALDDGLFSLCSGGVPAAGGFARVPGKTLRATGAGGGGVLSIYQFGNKIAVQRYLGVEIYDLRSLVPHVEDYVYDNEGHLVTDNAGIPITQ